MKKTVFVADLMLYDPTSEDYGNHDRVLLSIMPY